MKMCESYFDQLEEKKIFCTWCGTALDVVVLFCSFCGCEIYNNYNEHPQSTDVKKKKFLITSRKVKNTEQ